MQISHTHTKKKTTKWYVTAIVSTFPTAKQFKYKNAPDSRLFVTRKAFISCFFCFFLVAYKWTLSTPFSRIFSCDKMVTVVLSCSIPHCHDK